MNINNSYNHIDIKNNEILDTDMTDIKNDIECNFENDIECNFENDIECNFENDIECNFENDINEITKKFENIKLTNIKFIFQLIFNYEPNLLINVVSYDTEYAYEGLISFNDRYENKLILFINNFNLNRKNIYKICYNKVNYEFTYNKFINTYYYIKIIKY